MMQYYLFGFMTWLTLAATSVARADYDVMVCHSLHGNAPSGWDYAYAEVNGSDAAGYVISLLYADGRPSRNIPMTFVSSDQPGWNRTYAAEGCTIQFQIPIHQPDEGDISCANGSSWSDCINSIE